MLVHLLIKNYALIRHLEITPSERMNIITGETGAGKSIMIGAAGLLLGNRADSKVLYNKDEKCIIEGVFNLSEYQLQDFFEEYNLDYNEETIIRREISSNGKSRAFINDTPIVLEVMRNLGSYLMDIHSQNDTELLGTLEYQLSVVDSYSQNKEKRSRYTSEFNHYRFLINNLSDLELEAQTIRKEADYNQFLFNELDEANLVSEEQEELEEELKILEHAEEIKTRLIESLRLLQEDEFNILENLADVSKKINNISTFSHSLSQFNNRIESTLVELKDITNELGKETYKIGHQPHRLEELQIRLNEIYRLQQKHQVSTISQLIAIKDDLDDKVNKNISLDEEINSLKQDVAESFEKVLDAANELSSSRLNNLKNIEDQLEEMMRNLGVPEARVAISHTKTPPSKTGIDEIQLRFSANKGVTPMDLKAAASGGEFSRLMFCVKYIIASKTALPTLILDEIDAGISGEIAFKMSKMMQQMASQHQVVVITHLPQIASAGNNHYFVYKDNNDIKSVSLIKELDAGERVEEIAKMIGGDKPSDAAVINARELLANTYIN